MVGMKYKKMLDILCCHLAVVPIIVIIHGHRIGVVSSWLSLRDRRGRPLLSFSCHWSSPICTVLCHQLIPVGSSPHSQRPSSLWSSSLCCPSSLSSPSPSQPSSSSSLVPAVVVLPLIVSVDLIVVSPLPCHCGALSPSSTSNPWSSSSAPRHSFS